MAKWIKYQIVCNAEKNILLDKKLEYTDANIVIAQNEAYEGVFTIEEDGVVLEKEPLAVELGGTGAKVGTEACKNIGAVPVPVDSDPTEGFIYQNPDGTTKLTAMSNKFFKYSVLVDNGADGTPSAVEYADDCVGFTPMTMSNGVLNEGSWASNKLLEMFRPCVIAPDETPKYYLDKTNMSLKEDGTAAVLTGDDGDVMVEVDGLLYGKIENITSTKIKVSIMNYIEQGCFCFNDFGGDIRQKFYRGRYKGSIVDGTAGLRSVSGVAPKVSLTRDSFRQFAVARGDGYHQNNVYMLFLWQAMFLLLFKTRNSQSALGNGRTDASAAQNTGWSDNYGWIWGTTANSTDGVVFLGVEDFYGNVWEWVDGVVLNTLTYYLTRDPGLYNDTGSGFEISAASGLSNANNSGKYLTAVKGTNDLGFLPAATGGSSATYYCDYFWVNDSVQVARFGGAWNVGASAGAFCWYLHSSASGANATVGSRLCRK